VPIPCGSKASSGIKQWEGRGNRNGVWAYADGDELRLDLLEILVMSEKANFRCGLVRVLVLGVFLLLDACAEGNNGKKDAPVIYGNAGGGSGGGAATSGMSFSW
jgi:hypothetical protein